MKYVIAAVVAVLFSFSASAQGVPFEVKKFCLDPEPLELIVRYAKWDAWAVAEGDIWDGYALGDAVWEAASNCYEMSEPVTVTLLERMTTGVGPSGGVYDLWRADDGAGTILYSLIGRKFTYEF